MTLLARDGGAAEIAAEEKAGPVTPTVEPKLREVDRTPDRSASEQLRLESRGRHRLVLNAAAGGGANLIRIGIQVLMIPVLARLIGPTEFGLFALAMPTISLLISLADGGLGASMAREPDSSTDVWSTAFWILLGLGVALAIGVTGWGFVLALITNQPRLSAMMAFLSVSLIFLVIAVLPAARLVGQGRLFIISGGDLVSTTAGAIVAIALAFRGAGAWSLAAQYVVVIAVRAVVLNWAAFIRPRFVFRLAGLKDHLITGSSLLGVRLAEFGGRLVEYLAYERFFGTSSLGNYTFANQTPRFICEAISGPVWTALYAHALNERPDAIRNTHLKIVRILSLMGFPVAFLLAGTAREIIDLVLGEQWEQASGLLQILVPCYALSLIAGQSGAVMLAANRGWTLFWIIALGTVGRIFAVALGPWVGQTGVAICIAAVLVLTSAAFLFSPLVVEKTNRWSLVKAGITPFVSAAVAGLISYLVINHLPAGIVAIIVSLAAGLISYLGLLAALEGRQLLADLAAAKAFIAAR